MMKPCRILEGKENEDGAAAPYNNNNINNNSNHTASDARNRRKSKRSRLEKLVLGSIAGLTCFFLVSVWKMMSFLEFLASQPVLQSTFDYSSYRSSKNNRHLKLTTKETEQQQQKHSSSWATRIDVRNVKQFHEEMKPNKFIVFQSKLAGQGAGNLMNGLLAAHLLGEEFNRTVCVSKDYETFMDAFEAVDDSPAADLCGMLRRYPLERPNPSNTVRIVNFGETVDECQLQKVLGIKGPQMVYLLANTYPRWRDVPDQYFFRFYRARPQLLDMLPYYEPSKRVLQNTTGGATTGPMLLPSQEHETVLHLRAPDNENVDTRKGLDDTTLRALGGALPSDTYLVTNRVYWYDWFETKYGWLHPDWKTVVHSDLPKSWGVRANDGSIRETLDGSGYKPEFVAQFDHQLRITQGRQLWADWYSLLTAKHVYHTHSDFSASATHWVNHSSSKVVEGYNNETKQLILKEEVWRREPLMAPLSKRRRCDFGNDCLHFCLEDRLLSMGFDPEHVQAPVGVRSVVIRRGQKVFDSGDLKGTKL